MRKIFYPLFLLFSLQPLLAQRVIPLYDGKPKGSENWTWKEQISTENDFNTPVVYNVTQPTLTAYLPPYYQANGTAVIIAPGGAFHTLSIDHEGTEVAKWLNSKGVAAFVLKYRVARSYTDDPVMELGEKMKDFEKLNEENEPIIPLAMADGLAAVQYVREHATELDVNPEKIGFMGFSAGGTLTMSVVYNASDENRPNFIAPVYAYEPAIIGSAVPVAKTPIFVAVAGDDQLNMMPYSINIYQKWFEAGQSAELHIYQQGGHGFGMKKQKLPVDTWYERFGEWLHLQGYFRKLYPSKYEKLFGEDAVAQSKIDDFERMKVDYAKLEHYQEQNASLPPPKPGEHRVVFLGNSITAGWARSRKEFFEANNFVGRGISAQTSVQLLLRFRQDVVALKPEVVVIHIGTNDVAENTGPYSEDYTVGNIESMVEIARANGIKVALGAVLPSTKFEWNRAVGDRSDMIVALNERLKAYATANKIPYIDYHSAMKNNQDGMDPDIAPDGVHPAPKGFAIMERLVLEALKTVMD